MLGTSEVEALEVQGGQAVSAECSFWRGVEWVRGVEVAGVWLEMSATWENGAVKNGLEA